ncbi:MAG: 2,3-butanediol dehydrogenase [Desulfovibrio sp.]|jgi:(R,R)-butanediol dehydrogenase/meso-butanediol dehydrogenase/diacetyl reductase|nr:2,3-butanediol dehydrogenase [Desulfovibrio sp.]
MADTMQAAVWYGKKDIRIETVPVPPPPKPGWVQIKVDWCGICGSDLHEYLAGPIFIPMEPHPLTGCHGKVILGHEFSGVVVATGDGVNNVKVGDKVAPDACQHCGECQPCREGRYNVCEKLAFTGLMTDGAFARLVNVPSELCVIVPPGVSQEDAAVMEPLATGFKAVRMAGSILGLNIVILGAGTIGLGTLMAAKAAGAGQLIVVEQAAARIEKAKAAGADVIINSKEQDPIAVVKELTGGHGADVSFECIGNKLTGPLAVDVIRNTGTAIIVGIFEEPSPFNFFSLSGTDKRVYGSLAYTVEDFKGLAALMAKGAISAAPLITGKIELKDLVEKGFLELINNKDQNIKILVRP